MGLLKNIFGKKGNLGKKQVADYLKGNLDNEERRVVEHHLSECPLSSDAMEGFEEFGPEALDDVPSFSEFSKRRTGAKVRSLSGTVNRVAAMLIGVGILTSIFIYKAENKTERLYASYFSGFNDPDAFVMRSGTDIPDKEKSALDKAILVYQKDDFPTAILRLKSVLGDEPSNERASFYLGLAYLQNHNPEMALEQFSSFIGKEDSGFSKEAEWYAALSQVKLGNKNEAKDLLEKIKKDPNSYYRKRAESLLSDL